MSFNQEHSTFGAVIHCLQDRSSPDEQPDIAIENGRHGRIAWLLSGLRLQLAAVRSTALHKPSARVRISSLLPDWATPNGGEGGIGIATLRAFAPSLRLSVPLRCTNPRLGFAFHPSYLIGLRPMAEREGLVTLRLGLPPPASGCPFRCAAQTLGSGSHLIPLT
jgi:hypothetical protein